jgi:hypothetical protein
VPVKFAIIACCLSALTWAGVCAAETDGATNEFIHARADYFSGLQGNRAAEARATDEFAALERERPQDAVVMVYAGSVELLEAAHTWAVWNKHRLATEGLEKIDRAEQMAPNSLEVRFVHGATAWHLPFFYHRKEQAEQDFAFIAPRAEEAVRRGALPPQLAAAALDYYGRILDERNDQQRAKQAFEAAVRVDPVSPGGEDALRRLRENG